jgi:peptidoglycan/LPS O-acetylase OafA/YrhL
MGLLRTYLALSVVLIHAGPLYGMQGMPGDIAVPTFFMISGFYMTLILTTKYQGSDATRLYFINRFLRIFPLYWVVAFASLAYLTFFAPKGFDCAATHLAPHCVVAYDLIGRYAELKLGSLLYLLAVNATGFGQDLTLFLTLQDGSLTFTSNFWRDGHPVYPLLLMPQAWSLSLELVFYVLAPLLVRRSVGVVLGLLIASISLRVLIYNTIGAHDPWSYRLFPTELALFCAGILSCKLYQERVRWVPARRALPTAIVFLGLAGTYHWWRLPGAPWTFYAVAAVCLPFVFRATKTWAVDNLIGELSYPIFLVHILVVTIAVPVVVSTPYEKHLSLIVVTISVAVAALLWWFIERPLDAKRHALAGSRSIDGERVSDGRQARA